VEFEVGFDVVVNGQVFIPSGAAVTGSIREINKAGKGPAKVLIDLGPTQTVSGEMVRLVGPGTTTDDASLGKLKLKDVGGIVAYGPEMIPFLPVVVPVLGVMQLFPGKKVLLHKAAGCGWFGWERCGVWVVAHVAENVAVDPGKLKAAQAQLREKLEVALAQLRESLRQGGLPESSLDEGALLRAFSTPEFKARLLQQAGDLDAAIEEYQQTLALKPDSPGLRASASSLHFGLAELFREKRDFVHAVPEYRTAVQLDPKDERFRIGLVNALEDSGDLDTAVAESKEAIRIWPDRPYFHYLLGRLLVKKNDPDAAIVELQWVLKKEKNSLANCALGRALELKGDPQAALRQYRTAFRAHQPDDQCRAAYERLRLQLKK